MRGLIYLLSGVLLLLVACQQKNNPPQQETKAPVPLLEAESKPTNSLLTEYEQFLAKLDSNKVENMSTATTKYKELFRGQSQNVADSGYVLFEKFYLRVDKTINEIHFQDSSDYDPLVLIYDEPHPPALSQKLKDYNGKMKANGFEVAMTEGGTYLNQDRDFIGKHFYAFISPTLKKYLTQLNKENKEGFSEDGGLAITPTQLTNRVIWWENFISEHPNFILTKEAKSVSKVYLTTLLTGMDNSPVVFFGEDKLVSDYAQAYRHLQKKAPNSQANKTVQPYFKALQQSDTVRANELIKQYQQAGIIYNPYE